MSESKNCKKMELIADATVQKFFNHYLTEIFPEQLAKVIAAHNCDVTAHAEQISAKVEVAVGRLKLWIIALIFAGGVGGGVGLSRVLAAFVGH